jgi:hypothetical protein
MAKPIKRPLGPVAAAVVGAGAGLAVVAAVWGAAWAWPGGGGSERAARSPSPSATKTVTASAAAAPASPKAAPAAPTAQPEPGPGGATPAAQATPPVPVLATVDYEVAAKGEVGADMAAFAADVARYLADPLGWPAAGVAFNRVQSGGQITIWLAQASTVPSFSNICTSNLSCSIGPDIIINEVRWNEGALPGAMQGVPLDDYRKMVVNHEVGHWLGHHFHSACPGPGQLAPLMMQQSKGLDGCVFNPYPLPSELTAPDLLG